MDSIVDPLVQCCYGTSFLPQCGSGSREPIQCSSGFWSDFAVTKNWIEMKNIPYFVWTIGHLTILVIFLLLFLIRIRFGPLWIRIHNQQCCGWSQRGTASPIFLLFLSKVRTQRPSCVSATVQCLSFNSSYEYVRFSKKIVFSGLPFQKYLISVLTLHFSRFSGESEMIIFMKLWRCVQGTCRPCWKSTRRWPRSWRTTSPP